MSESDDVKNRFKEFLGEEKFLRFMDKLTRFSEDKYELYYFQEKLLNDFCNESDLDVEPIDVLKSISDGTEYRYRCPNIGCHDSMFSYTDEKGSKGKKGKKRWGCSCGKDFAFSSMQMNIEWIVKRYPYRKEHYVTVDGKFFPSDPDTHSKKVEKLIDRELRRYKGR